MQAAWARSPGCRSQRQSEAEFSQILLKAAARILRADIGIDGVEHGLLSIWRFDVLIAQIVERGFGDLRDITIMGRVHAIELRHGERKRIPPALASPWTGVDADIDSRGDRQ